jgi:hypothetical protein
LPRKAPETRQTGSAAKLVRLGPADAELLERLCGELSLPASEVWRRCLRAVGHGEPLDRRTALAIEEQLRKVGTNLNQIARRYNSGQVVADPELAEALEAVADMLARTTRSLREVGVAARDKYRARAGAMST